MNTQQYSSVENKYFLLFLGIMPILIAAESLKLGLIIGALYFFMISIAVLTVSLSRFFSDYNFFFFLQNFIYALILVFVTTLLRIISPFLFEELHPVLYMFAFTTPVLTIFAADSKQSDQDWAWQKISEGLLYMTALVIIGFLRELLGTGSITLFKSQNTGSESLLAIFLQPSGAFILIGILFAVFKFVSRKTKGGAA